MANVFEGFKRRFNVLRPPIDIDNYDTSQPLTFFLLSMDETNSITTRWDFEKKLDENIRPNYWSYYVRLFGVNKIGQCVSVYVEGFKPFLYIEAPKKWNELDMHTALQRVGNDSVLTMNAKFDYRSVSHIEETWRTNIYGFTNYEKIKMFKISFHNVRGRKNLIKLLEENRTLDNYDNLGHEFWLWDACVPPITQFNNVTDIKPSRWITIDAGQYVLHDSAKARGGRPVKIENRRTREQIDVDCKYQSLHCDHDRDEIAPFYIESWDIEVKGEENIFPDPEKADYPVIQVGSTAQRYGDPRGQYLFQCCFCLKQTVNLRPKNMVIHWFEKEAELLRAYYYYWTDCLNADVRVAFNQYGFDEPYMYNRYMKLLTDMIPKQVLDGTASFFDKGALDYGKIRNERSALESRFTGSKAHGGTTKHTVKQVGRVQIDLYCVGREQWSIILGLNKMSAKFLGEDQQKDDIHYTQISPMFEKDAHSRGLLARYCVRDTELPLMILDKKCTLIELIEASRLTGVPLDTLFNKKQTVRAETLLYYNTHISEERYSIPQHRIRFVKDPNVAALFRGEHKQEGALVLEAEANFYSQPICTLDFAGLYPSIMRGYGLCYTTLILDPKYLSTTEHRLDVVRNKDPAGKPYNFYWALPKDSSKKPLLYKIITNILDARQRAKNKRKEYEKRVKAAQAAGKDYAEDEFMFNVYDKRQLALKVIANSQYGYTIIGYDQCKLSCPAIGVTVTHYGRKLINETRKAVHDKVPGSRCVYGDSVTGDTTLCLRLNGKITQLTSFDNLQRLLGIEWERYRDGKESLEFSDNNQLVEVWSEKGFTRVDRFIRHSLAPGKRMFRVSTQMGVVDVTEDHSLLLENTEKCVSVPDLVLGTSLLLHSKKERQLLQALRRFDCEKQRTEVESLLSTQLYLWGELFSHDNLVENNYKSTDLEKFRKLFFNSIGEKYLPPILFKCSPAQIKQFLKGFFHTKPGSFDKSQFKQSGKLVCSGLWYLYRLLEIPISIEAFYDGIVDTFLISVGVLSKDKRSQITEFTHTNTYDEPNIFELSYLRSLAGKEQFAVQNITLLDTSNIEYVYDVSTENHHFHVAPGNIVVHNTDSVMIKFNEDDSKKAFQDAFVVGKRLAAEITEMFPPEVVLEFEKVYYPYIQYGQKRYVGIKYEKVEDEGKLKCAGMKSVKGDTIKFLSRVETVILDMMARTGNHLKAKEYMIKELTKFVREPIDSSEVSISTKMSKEINMYSTSNQLARIASAMAKRNPGLAPRAGDKITFLHCLDKNNGNEPIPVDVEFYEANKQRFAINKEHYLKNLLKMNLGRLFDLPTVAHDPYQWFEPFENALVCAKNGGGMNRFFKKSEKNSSEDSEFPMRLFKDTPYRTESKLKKQVRKKVLDKKFKDECRRLEITAEEGKRRAQKRKSKFNMSQFFMVNKKSKK